MWLVLGVNVAKGDLLRRDGGGEVREDGDLLIAKFILGVGAYIFCYDGYKLGYNWWDHEGVWSFGCGDMCPYAR